ncbi:X8 domain [Dillenia turbinata]|uniref:X8 domain n=1 Tax=Dillenia turbinata TaxID=194707 RepID=A0AAN8V0Q7_9MAGN
MMLVSLLIVLYVAIQSDAQQQVWCVASPGASSVALQKGLDWACYNGADCSNIQPNQPCYEPNTVKDHASYAFNSYYQKFKKIGGTCSFGNAAITTNTDPSKVMVFAILISFPDSKVQEAWNN